MDEKKAGGVGGATPPAAPLVGILKNGSIKRNGDVVTTPLSNRIEEEDDEAAELNDVTTEDNNKNEAKSTEPGAGVAAGQQTNNEQNNQTLTTTTQDNENNKDNQQTNELKAEEIQSENQVDGTMETTSAINDGQQMKNNADVKDADNNDGKGETSAANTNANKEPKDMANVKDSDNIKKDNEEGNYMTDEENMCLCL